MNVELLPLLRCPNTRHSLAIEPGTAEMDAAGNLRSGWLVTASGTQRYPVRDGIPRFVGVSNYADNFGMQWNHFSRTQLDSFSGHPISASRFWKATGWSRDDLRGKWVLDVGCGAGRFAEIALECGANVVALDYSNAVDACGNNLRGKGRLHVVQGDIYALPFADGSFDFVYSLGVLQHTPDVEGAFAALPPMLAPGGRLCVDYYEKSLKSALLPKYWLRPVTKRLPKHMLFGALQRAVPAMLSLSNVLGSVPLAGQLLRRLVPVASYQGILPLSSIQHREWALLDTFDWLAPEYDHPQTPMTARRWFEQSGLQDIEVFRASHLVARGTRRSGEAECSGSNLEPTSRAISVVRPD